MTWLVDVSALYINYMENCREIQTLNPYSIRSKHLDRFGQ